MKHLAWRLVAVFFLFVIPALSGAQTSPDKEYYRYLSPSMTISPQSSFGEQLSFRDGALAFRNTDIVLAGIGPTIQITRSLRISGQIYPQTTGNRVGGWEIEVPRLSTLVNANTAVTQYSSVLWQVNAINRNARCSNFSGPGTISFRSRSSEEWTQGEWWDGYRFTGEDGDEQSVLAANSAAIPASYKAVTKSRWVFSCLPATANGQPGEGFLAVSPNGTKYWLNYLVYQDAGDTCKPNSLCIILKHASLMVTRVEDRFGNWLTYQYNGANLERIDASDGRSVVLTRSGTSLIVSTGSGSATRQWQYLTTNGYLTALVLPDGSRWSYNLAALAQARLYNPSQEGNCFTPRQAPTDGVFGNTLVGTVTTPSGATSEFRMRNLHIGRSYVPYSCAYPGDGSSLETKLEGAPKDSWGLALVGKTITGPGISPQTWQYNYSPGSSSWASGCTSGCNSTVWTDAISPMGTRQRYVFSNRYGETENLLLREEVHSAGTDALIKSTDYSYATYSAAYGTPNPYPWVEVGTDLVSRNNAAITQRQTPIRQTVINQDGVTFNSYVNNYDALARAINVTKYSSLGYSKIDAVEYYDDTALWVLGQLKRAWNVNTGLVSQQIDYWPATALQQRIWAFGKAQTYFEYNANGTMAKSVDGRDNATLYTNWYRGIPRNIGYADGTSVSAVVDDNGWVRAVTDENGFATGYGYDAMGRLGGIVYPNEDNLNYHPVQISFQQINFEEHGLPAGHWRLSRYEGNRHVNKYYDALWRPVLEETLDASNIAGTLSQVVKNYDAAGRLIIQSYPQRGVNSAFSTYPGVTTTYEPLGRVAQVRQTSELGDLITTTEYLAGFQVRTTNPRGFQATNGYQIYDQPSYDLLAWSAQPEGKVVEITRDIFGKPSLVKQRAADNSVSALRQYIYDIAHQQLCKTIEPETGTTVYGWDGAGNLAWSASGQNLPNAGDCEWNAAYTSGRRVDRAYDARNRLTNLAFPDGRGNQAIEYWPDGLQKKVTTYNDPGNGAPVINDYVYNRRRMLAGESQSQPGWYTWSLGYGYDPNANLSTQSYPDSMMVGYSPNALGQARSVTNLNTNQQYATGVSYYPNGGIQQFTYGNGVVHTMLQNTRQLPQRSQDVGVINYSFSYDQNANPNAIYDDQQGSGFSRWMGYDGLDRLTAAGSASFGGDHWHRFSYSALDNITSNKLPGVRDYATYIYDSNNRLTQINNSVGAAAVSLSYDAQGNLSNKSGQGYYFDYGNRLRGTYGMEWYRYDGAGRRVLKWRVNEPGELSIYSSTGQLMYEDNYRADTRKSFRYVYLSGSLIATREYGFDTGAITTKYHHTDALGSPVAVTNESAQVVDRTAWEPYGAAINKPSYDGVGYTSHMMDGATGLTYMQQRYYDPQIGRFLSVDPVTADPKSGGNFNRYWYANNNPYRFTDPDGRLAAGGSGCDIECKREKESERRRKSDEPYTGGVISRARVEGDRLTQPWVSPSWSSGSAHNYSIGPTLVCQTNSICNADSVGDVAEFYSVPFQLGWPESGKISILGMDDISHFRQGNISVNVTLPDHRYYPGAVIHASYNLFGSTWLYTRGAGNGPNPNQNAIVGHYLFGRMHLKVYEYFNPVPPGTIR